MKPSRAPRSHLVVYYSRSGATRQAASTLAEILGADLLEIQTDRPYRSTARGYALASWDTLLGREPEIRFLGVAPEINHYSCVVVCTPVWFSSVSPPVRTFLKRNRTSFKNVAFVLTHGGSGAERTFSQMTEIAGMTPIASLALRDRDLQSGLDSPNIKVRLDAFIREVGFTPQKEALTTKAG